jgi:hypothetical protein
MNTPLSSKEKTGYVFMCSDATENECLERHLLGGTTQYAAQIKNLKKGDAVYLYNFNQKRLHGPFVAMSGVQNNIVPDAWGGQYPVQVRFSRTHHYLPIYRDQLVGVIRFNPKGYPITEVSAEQIEQLEKLFKAKKRAKNYDDSASIPTLSGHRVRSKGEEKIADWLYTHRIAFAYEGPIPGSTKRCDFYIPLKDHSGIYIEFWGLTDEKYLLNKKEKLGIYKAQNLQLIEITPKELRMLDMYLLDKLASFFLDL